MGDRGEDVQHRGLSLRSVQHPGAHGTPTLCAWSPTDGAAGHSVGSLRLHRGWKHHRAVLHVEEEEEVETFFVTQLAITGEWPAGREG